MIPYIGVPRSAPLLWWLSEKCIPHIGGHCKGAPLHWWGVSPLVVSGEIHLLKLVVIGEVLPCIGGKWRVATPYWKSLDTWPLTLVMSWKVLPYTDGKWSGSPICCKWRNPPPLNCWWLEKCSFYLESQKGRLATPMYENIWGLPLQISFLNASWC